MYHCKNGCPDAVAYVRGGPSAPALRGEVRFFQQSRNVLVEVEVTGLPQNNASGFFALHIHQGPGCGGEGFANTGGHFDPEGGMGHPNHAGDLPPLLLCNGGAWLAVKTDRFGVGEVIGRTVVIHSGADDFHSQPSGNAGTKIACGVIQASKHETMSFRRINGEK